MRGYTNGMSAIPTIIIVGADKGGVGKTTVTRVLLDYLKTKGISRKVFDTEYPSGDLKRFAPDAEIIDITKIQYQMKVFDSIDQSAVTVIDLRAGLLSQILVELDNANLLEDVRRGHLNLVLLHILGPTITSILEVTTAAERIGGGARHFLVKNHISEDTAFFEWDRGTSSPLAAMQDLTITVPQLNQMAAEHVQKAGGTFLEFAHPDSKNSRMLKSKVNGWTKAVFDEFDRVKLPEIIG